MRLNPFMQHGSFANWLARVVVLAGAVTFVASYQRAYFSRMEVKPELFEQELRLPSSDALKVGTLGFKNLYADYMFLRAIQAFGAGWLRPNQSREPIFNYFDTVSDVDPKFTALYRFGNLIIADQGGDGPRGQKLLKKGLRENPNSWEIAYLGIYNAIWLMNEPDEALYFLRIARNIRDTPEFVLRMEEYVERRQGRYEAAFDVTVDYFMRYRAAGNKLELGLLNNRFAEILDKWYRREMYTMAERYLEAKGEHPKRMEDILVPPYAPGFVAPTIESILTQAEVSDQRGLNVEQATELVRTKSRIRIDGLPPDPYGTWYFISSMERNEVLDRRLSANARAEDRFAYIIAANDLNSSMNGFQNSIFERYILPKLRENPNVVLKAEEFEKFASMDPLGGHYRFDEMTQRFLSTARMRMARGEEPRVGAWGRPPFPFPFELEPKLTDYKEDFDWGLKVGLLDPLGNWIIDPYKKRGNPLLGE